MKRGEMFHEIMAKRFTSERAAAPSQGRQIFCIFGHGRKTAPHKTSIFDRRAARLFLPPSPVTRQRWTRRRPDQHTARAVRSSSQTRTTPRREAHPPGVLRHRVVFLCCAPPMLFHLPNPKSNPEIQSPKSNPRHNRAQFSSPNIIFNFTICIYTITTATPHFCIHPQRASCLYSLPSSALYCFQKATTTALPDTRKSYKNP